MSDRDKKPDLPEPPKEPDTSSFYGTEEDTEELEKELEDENKDD